MKTAGILIAFTWLYLLCGCHSNDPQPISETLCAKTSFEQENTFIGLHGSMDAEAAIHLNAQIVRFGFADFKIRQAFDKNGGEDFLETLQKFKDANIRVINYITWPEDTISEIGADYERVPRGKDKEETLVLLDQYLETAGPYLDWVQINQEPFGVTPYREADATVDPQTGRVPALEWWETVAERICEKRNQNPALAHLKILSPGITGIKNLVRDDSPDPDFDEQPVTASLIDSIIVFAEEYCDAIDLHLHTESVELGIAEIDYIGNRTDMPLGATEWSQAHVAKSSGWLDEVNSIYGLSNRNVIKAAYENPFTPEEWQSFLAAGPQTDGFIPDFYVAMQARHFLFACYGGLYQYGSPAFDWKMIYAQKTTKPSVANQPFYDEFVSLTE